MYMLAIDVGSSFLKSAILDLDGKRILQGDSSPTPGFVTLPPERKEIPMDKLTAAVKDLIDRAAANYKLEGIVFSVQMHGFMLFNKAGVPVSNYISWQDIRAMIPDETGKPLIQQIKEMVPPHMFRESGINLRQNHSLLPLYHYLKENPLTEPVEFAMIGDSIARILTGQRAAVHPSQAASSGLYSLEKGDWNRELIEFLGMDAVDFPPVSEGKEPVAVYKSANGDIPIYTALGDHQAAVLGTCAGAGDMFINIGTGGQIGFVDNGLALGTYETRPFFQGHTIRAFTQLPSGRSLNVLMGFIMDIGREIFGNTDMQEKDVWRRLDQLTADPSAADAGLKLDFSYFDPDGGAISGISGSNLTVGKLFSSAYDSMAAAYYNRSRDLLTEGDSEPVGVVCTGGVVRKNTLLMECIGKQFGIPCRLAPYSDDTLVGLLRFALWCKKDVPMFGEKFVLGE